MTTAQASSGWILDERRTVRAAIGLITDGELRHGETTHDVDSGGIAALGFEYLAVMGRGSRPTIDLSASLGFSWAQTKTAGAAETSDYTATDVRLGARAGWLIGANAFPFVAARLFGGPVRWVLAGDEVTGGDTHHYQLALGAAVPIGPLALHGEWAGAGEKGWSVGVSGSW